MINSDENETIQKEKIIPDGYPEMIFHYGEPYQQCIKGKWSLQDKYLIAGQISNYFFLERTGKTGIFAIKFQPWALTTLFNLNMSSYTDRIVPINLKAFNLEVVKDIAIGSLSFEDKITAIENWFSTFLSEDINFESEGRKATQIIIEKKGAINLQDVYQQMNITERRLERHFKNQIGLSPKFYCRIIRFSEIFELIQQENINWSDIAHHAGFYDQSHFIRNFKEFTGEKPSEYGFYEENLANFFLRK